MEFDYKPNKACQSINTMKRKPAAILHILLLGLGDTAEMSPSLSSLYLLVHLWSLSFYVMVILLAQQFPLFLINTRKKRQLEDKFKMEIFSGWTTAHTGSSHRSILHK